MKIHIPIQINDNHELFKFLVDIRDAIDTLQEYTNSNTELDEDDLSDYYQNKFLQINSTLLEMQKITKDLNTYIEAKRALSLLAPTASLSDVINKINEIINL